MIKILFFHKMLNLLGDGVCLGPELQLGCDNIRLAAKFFLCFFPSTMNLVHILILICNWKSLNEDTSHQLITFGHIDMIPRRTADRAANNDDKKEFIFKNLIFKVCI